MSSDSVFWSRLTDEEKAAARAAVDARLGKLPDDATEGEMEAAAQDELEPYRRIAARRAEQWEEQQRQEQEQRNREQAVRRDRQIRNDLLSYPWLSLPWSFTQQEKDQTIAAARKTMDKLPHGASRAQLEQARDSVVVPAVQAHERRKAAESRVNALLLDAIESAIANEERDGLELDAPLDRVNFKLEVRDAIRGPLVDWLSRIKGLTDDQLRLEIERRARRCARELVPER